jgi:uncharacterized protein YecE (DUF72 family)
MITLGATTWTEHPILIDNVDRPVQLREYAAYFPVVEVDTSFYGIPSISTVQGWLKQVPSTFQFILKAHRFMTGHLRPSDSKLTVAGLQRFFNEYVDMLQPLLQCKQLKTVLFQFPPYFQCNQKNVAYLSQIRKWLGDEIPVSVEFRNASWLTSQVQKDLVLRLKQLHFTFVMADEPHNINDGVAFTPLITNNDLAMLRLHGRNAKGWFNRDANWRKQRTLYRYSREELLTFQKIINQVASQTKEVCIIFNNNSGRDAAPNALELQQLMQIHFQDLAPKQLDLFKKNN